MRRSALWKVVVALATGLGAYGQTFVYTNNDLVAGNTVTTFSMAGTGVLSLIADTPTGGLGGGGGLFAANRTTIGVVGNLLYVSNGGSATISGFTINPATGALTAVPGSPFATGTATPGDISLAVTPNSRFLYAANARSDSASAFVINANGSLTAVPGSPFAAGDEPDGIKISPDGLFLSVALAGTTNAVAMFVIAPNGALIPAHNSPFAAGGGTSSTGADINCGSRLLFNAQANSVRTAVGAYTIGPHGNLTAVAGSPFLFASGANSNVGVLSPDDRFLFVSNQNTNTVTVLNVAGTGALSLVAGSPFAVPGVVAFPSGMATTKDGAFLLVSSFAPSAVAAFSVAAGGSLTPVAGSPFATGKAPASGLLSLAVYPSKNCGCLPPFRTHGHIATDPPTHSGTSHAHHGTNGHTVSATCPVSHVPGHNFFALTEAEEGLASPLTAGLDVALGAEGPAERGGTLRLFGPSAALFFGEHDGPSADDFTAPSAGPLYYTTSLPEVRIGGQPAKVVFSGLAPGLTGVWQINIQVPYGLPAGRVPVVV